MSPDAGRRTVTDFGLDESEQWLANWSASISEHAVQAQQLATRVAALSASASGANGDVQVTVGSSGQVTDLKLAERTRNMAAAQLATVILVTMRKAQAKLPDLAAEVAKETVGARSPAAQAVVSAFGRRFSQSGGETGATRRDGRR